MLTIQIPVAPDRTFGIEEEALKQWVCLLICGWEKGELHRQCVGGILNATQVAPVMHRPRHSDRETFVWMRWKNHRHPAPLIPATHICPRHAAL